MKARKQPGCYWETSRMMNANWLEQQGFIQRDEGRQARLTLEGKKRAAAQLDKLPLGNDLLLEIAVCEAYEIEAKI